MSSPDFECFLQCGKPCEESDSTDGIREESWDNIKLKALSWKGLDRFENVYDAVNWELGPRDKHAHANCRIDIFSSDKLNRSKTRLQKRERESASVDSICQDDMSAFSPKRLRSSVGAVHHKHLCVWCMKPEDIKNTEPSGKWLLISYKPAWNVFRSHTVGLEDDSMRDRINRLIDSTTDPFAAEIWYHHKCWLKYVSSYQKMSVEQKLSFVQDVTFREAQTMFIDHVRHVVFEDHEIRTLQGLLHDYKTIVGVTYGFPTSGVKSSYIKEVLVREFGSDVGFHARPQQNQSEVVYDTGGGGSYIEAAITSLGISSEQLVQNIASRLCDDVKSTKTVPWPPQVAELEQEEDLSPLLVQLVSALKKSGHGEPDTKAGALAYMLTYDITGNPTTTSINLGMNLHGLTRSRELVDTFHKVGVCIGYPSVLLLRDAWAVHDLQLCIDCPNEIAEDVPGVVIVDNDDFRNDTLTGGDTSHRTNVMYVQRESLENRDIQCGERVKDAKAISSTLKEIVTSMQTHDRYVTHTRGEPSVSNRVETEIGGTEPQRKRGVIYSLVHADAAGERPASVDQLVPAFSGFQSLISAPVERSNAYYFMTYSDPPKKSVLNVVMLKVTRAIQSKRMPFAVVVGDQPVYTLIVEIKSEQPQTFEKIIPFLGPFHTQGCMIYAIYKRHKGSEIAELLAAAGVIAEGSVDQALRGKHHRRALRCLMLMYEALMHLLLDRHLTRSDIEASTRARIAVLRDPKMNSHEAMATAHEEL